MNSSEYSSLGQVYERAFELPEVKAGVPRTGLSREGSVEIYEV